MVKLIKIASVLILLGSCLGGGRSLALLPDDPCPKRLSVAHVDESSTVEEEGTSSLALPAPMVFHGEGRGTTSSGRGKDQPTHSTAHFVPKHPSAFDDHHPDRRPIRMVTFVERSIYAMYCSLLI